MDIIKELFDYQLFSRNKRIERRAQEVFDKYLSGGAELDDDELSFVAAAGETDNMPDVRKQGLADEHEDG